MHHTMRALEALEVLRNFYVEQIRNDKGCLRDILALEVTCPTTPPCTWRGKLVDMEV